MYISATRCTYQLVEKSACSQRCHLLLKVLCSQGARSFNDEVCGRIPKPTSDEHPRQESIIDNLSYHARIWAMT